MAIVWAQKKFRRYLHGFKIINRVDHLALTFLKTCKFVNAMLTRWNKTIHDYQIEIEHLPGKENVTADVLSRLNDGETFKKIEERLVLLFTR